MGTCAHLLVRFVLSGTFKPTRYQPSEQRVETTSHGAGGNLKNEQITSCLGSDEQHAPRTHKHRRPCATHAHDTGVRARTCLHGLFSVKHSYQHGTFQCTSSCNNRLRCRWIPQRTIKLRVAWQVMGNTRPVRTNTADRAACTLTTQMYVRVLVCTVCFQ